MNHRIRSVAAGTALASMACVATAQLAPPIEQRTPPGAAPAPTIGQGAGYHDPRSAFKPLEDKEGIVSWKLLSSVKSKVEGNKMWVVFPDEVKALNEKTVRVQGFMMPLEPGDKQKHFLLSAVPTTCSFCIPAGPSGLIEVRSKVPVKYSIDPVVVEGRFAALTKDPYGLYFRVTDAAPAP